MARPQVVDGGERLQKWKVAVNILNNESRTADKGQSTSLGVGVGLTTPYGKQSNLLRNVSKHLRPGLIIRHEQSN
jgi:hypothetical protein